MQEERLLTLILAAQANDGQGKEFIVMGADTRETLDTGSVRVEVNIAEKLHNLTRHTAITLCGDSGHAQHLVSKFRREKLRGREVGIIEVVQKFSDFCKDEARSSAGVPTFGRFPPNNRHIPDMGFVIAGFSKEGDDFVHPMCYRVSSLTGYLIEFGGGGFAIDGKGAIARYLFSKEYRPPMDLPTVSTLVLKCLVDTSEVDGDVGGRYKLAIIDSNGIVSKPLEEIEEMIEDAKLRWEH